MNRPCCQTSQTCQYITCQTCHQILYHAHLRVLNHLGHDQTVALPLRDFTVGRNAENDLVLSVEGVSRQHLRLRFVEGVYHVEDCGSKNGLFINGQKLGKKELQNLDYLQIGPVLLFFFLTEYTAGEKEPPPAPPRAAAQPDTPKAAPSIEMRKHDEKRWRELLMHHFLRGALRLSSAGVASLWLPEISGELTLKHQMNAGQETRTPLSHAPWHPLAEKVFQSGSIILRERAETKDLGWENLLAIAGRAHRILGIPLRAFDQPGAPAGVLLLEDAQAKGSLTWQEAQGLQKLVERSAICMAQICRDEDHQDDRDHEAEPEVPMRLGQGDIRPLAVPPYDLAYASRTSGAGAAGGDYLEVMAINETELAIAIGDVAGKGTAAAKMRDRLQAYFRLHVLYESRPEAWAQGLNQLVFDMRSTAAFTTLFLGVLNLQRGVLLYVNAGHNPGVMIYPSTAAPRFELLRSSGAALGVLESNPIAEIEIAIPAGAALIFYTDGVTEATGADGKPYGLTRLIECATSGVFAAKNLSASQLLGLVLKDLPYAAALAAGVWRPQDDQSVLVMIARA